MVPHVLLKIPREGSTRDSLRAFAGPQSKVQRSRLGCNAGVALGSEGSPVCFRKHRPSAQLPRVQDKAVTYYLQKSSGRVRRAAEL